MSVDGGKGMQRDDTILAPISIGELFDKITILQIKSEKLSSSTQLENVRRELDLLDKIADDVRNSHDIELLVRDLSQVNLQLWDVEDRLRMLEAEGDFDTEFVAKARQVYQLNDQRAKLKRQINMDCGSAIVEEKSYGSPRRMSP